MKISNLLLMYFKDTKKVIMPVFTVILLLALISCNPKDSRYAIIRGQYMDNVTGKEIHLCKVEHGQRVKVATTTIGDDGYFGLMYRVDEPGIYVINTVFPENPAMVTEDHNLKRFYLEAGTEIEIKLTDGKYRLVDANNKKNRLLTEWNLQVDTVFTYSHGFFYASTTYKEFFPLLPGYVKQAEMFKKNISSGDSSFDELMKLMVDTDISRAAIRFLYTPRIEHPKREDYPEYYDQIIESGKPKSTRLLELPDGMNYVHGFIRYSTGLMPKGPSRNDYFYVGAELVLDDLLKGYYAIDNLNRFRAYDEDFMKFKERVTPYLQNDYLKERFIAYEISIRKFEKGAEAFDFTGIDVNGKECKLSDFKGHLVYVDVWATWCGPCKAQIPALKELEKKFHGQPITFLSISVDKPNDHQKWVDFVKDEKLSGVQLMADKAFDSDITKVYGINAIPRFMLFDKEGKVVTIDAPRPSEDKTEAWLKSML